MEFPRTRVERFYAYLRVFVVYSSVVIRKFWWIGLIIVFGIGGFWWFRQSRKLSFREFTVTRQRMAVSLTASGSIVADRKADLTFQTGGRLVWVGVAKGDRVKKWQGVASLDQRTLQKTIEKELNDYLKVRWDFQTTRESNNVSTDNLDAYTLSPATRRVLEKSQFDLNNAVLDVEVQEVAKEFVIIVAPFEGLVTDVSASLVGTNVTAATVIATVIDPTSLYFEAHVDELDIGKLTVRQLVTLTLDAYPDDPITTTIESIGFSPVALSGGGTGYQVRIPLPVQTEDMTYKLGMNGDADIIINDLGEVLTLPQEAITRKEGKTVVQELIAGKPKEIEIETGEETESLVEIKDGVSEGEVVVVRDKSNAR